MMFGQGLSLDQAPPIGVPGRFFLTAPLFGLLAGVMLAVYPEIVLSRWAPVSTGWVHLVTLGVISMVMAGALFQMLPVVAGVRVPGAKGLAFGVHAGLIAGALGMASGLAFSKTALLIGGAAAAGLSLGLFAMVLFWRLGGANPSSTVRAMQIAAAGLLITVVLGITLAMMKETGAGAWYPALLQVHLLWANIAWVAVLIIGVAFQVVPMFYVADSYPTFCTRWVLGVVAGVAVALLAATGLSAFSAVTVRRLLTRRRKVRDASLGFWYLGMGMLALFGCALLLDLVTPVPDRLLGVLFGAGFVLSVIIGMLLKIVPFLVWFHLTWQGRVGVPVMKELIDPRFAWAQLGLHGLTVVFLAVALFVPVLAPYAGGIMALSFGWLGVGLGMAFRRYRLIQRQPDLAAETMAKWQTGGVV